MRPHRTNCLPVPATRQFDSVCTPRSGSGPRPSRSKSQQMSSLEPRSRAAAGAGTFVAIGTIAATRETRPGRERQDGDMAVWAETELEPVGLKTFSIGGTS